MLTFSINHHLCFLDSHFKVSAMHQQLDSMHLHIFIEELRYLISNSKFLNLYFNSKTTIIISSDLIIFIDSYLYFAKKHMGLHFHSLVIMIT